MKNPAPETAFSVGALLRQWRLRRRRSQLDVALAAGVSTRHLSCLETGRALPSRTMIARLSDELEVPLRDRNALCLAAGLAPQHRERPLADLGPARQAIEAVLHAHNPNPSVAVDTHWNLLAANTAMQRFLTGIPDTLTGPPMNMLRMTLHPDGMAGQLENLTPWRAHVLRRVRRQLDHTADPALADLLTELESYGAATPDHTDPSDDIAMPMRLNTPFGPLALLYTVTVFGSPRDITLDEIAIETFFPADEATRTALVQLHHE